MTNSDYLTDLVADFFEHEGHSPEDARRLAEAQAARDPNNKGKGGPTTMTTHVKITSLADFSATTVTVEPVTDFGREIFAEFFGYAVSVELRKSGAGKFLEAVELRAVEEAERRA